MSSQESVVSTKKKMCSHFQIMFSRLPHSQIHFFCGCAVHRVLKLLRTNVVDDGYSAVFVSNIVNKLFLDKIWWVSVAKSWCRPVRLAKSGLLLQNWGTFSMLARSCHYCWFILQNGLWKSQTVCYRVFFHWYTPLKVPSTKKLI